MDHLLRRICPILLSVLFALSVLGGCKGGGGGGAGGGGTISAPPPPAPGPETGAVTLEWNVVTQDVLGNPESVGGYRVYVARGSPAFGAPSYIVNSPIVEISDLLIGVVYYVSVRAYDSSGNESTLSAPLSIQI